MKFDLSPRGAAVLAVCALAGAMAWNWISPARAHAQTAALVGTYSAVLETQYVSGSAVVNVPAVGQLVVAGGQVTGVVEERSADGLVERAVKGGYTQDSNGIGRLSLSYEVAATDSEGSATTETVTRNYVVVASGGGAAAEGLRSDAGPIERVTLSRQ